MDDIFRSFFGIPRRGNGDSFEDMFRGRLYFQDYDDIDDDDDECCHGDEDEIIIGTMPDIGVPFDFSQADDMFRHFEEMFKNFGMVEFPPQRHFEDNQEKSGSLRDRMLKDGTTSPESRSDTPDPVPDDRRPGMFDSPSIFGNLWRTPRWDRIRPADKIDKDLDGELSKDDLDRIATESKQDDATSRAVMKPFGSQGFFKSVSVQTIRKSDGTVEHVKTIRNGDGTEEKSVTRTVDDKSYSVVTKRNKDGEEEKIETFKNIDENSLPEFNKKWSESGRSSSPRNQLVLPEDEYDNESKSMFSKFFGFTWPGSRKS